MPKLAAGADVGAGAGAARVAPPASSITTGGPTAKLGRAHEAATVALPTACQRRCGATPRVGTLTSLELVTSRMLALPWATPMHA